MPTFHHPYRCIVIIANNIVIITTKSLITIIVVIIIIINIIMIIIIIIAPHSDAMAEVVGIVTKITSSFLEINQVSQP